MGKWNLDILYTGFETEEYKNDMAKLEELIPSLTELASELGKASAVMSTEKSTGATPSAFSAHEFDRDNSDEIKLSPKSWNMIRFKY